MSGYRRPAKVGRDAVLLWKVWGGEKEVEKDYGKRTSELGGRWKKESWKADSPSRTPSVIQWDTHWRGGSMQESTQPWGGGTWRKLDHEKIISGGQRIKQRRHKARHASIMTGGPPCERRVRKSELSRLSKKGKKTSWAEVSFTITERVKCP